MLFTANMSARYHRRRAAFLETVNNFSNFAVAPGHSLASMGRKHGLLSLLPSC